MNDLEFAKLLNGLPDEMLSEAYMPKHRKHHVIYMISAAAACIAAVIAAAVYAKISMDPPDRIIEPAMTSRRSAQTTSAVISTTAAVTSTALSHNETQTETAATETAVTTQTTSSTVQTFSSAVTTAQTEPTQSSTVSASTVQTTYLSAVTTAVTVSYTQKTTVTTAFTEQMKTSATTASVSYSSALETKTETLPVTTEIFETSVMGATSCNYETTGVEATTGSGYSSPSPEETEIVLYFLDESEHQPVIGAEIQIFNLDGSLLTETVTDGNPIRLTMMTGERYRLHISAVPEGYSVSRRNHLFTAGSEPIQIYLKHQ